MSHQATTWVMEFSQSRLADRLVLGAIAHRISNDSGEAFPSIATIAREANVSESSVHASLKSLAKMGELEIDRGASDYGTNIYRMPQFVEWLVVIRSGARGAKSAPIRRRICTRGVQSTELKGSKSAPEPSFPTITEPETKNTHTAPAALGVCASELFSFWNENRGPLPEVTPTNGRRAKVIAKLQADPNFTETFKHAVLRARVTPFCCGGGKLGWKASFDWMVTSDNCVAVIEGKYSTGRGDMEIRSATTVGRGPSDAITRRHCAQCGRTETFHKLPPERQRRNDPRWEPHEFVPEAEVAA